MPNANWSNPTLTSTYTNFVTEVKSRDEDLALQFDGTTSTNLVTNTIRWDSSANRWKKWNGASWAELTATYALTALTTTGNVGIGTTSFSQKLTVDGSIAMNGGFLIPYNGATPTGYIGYGTALATANDIAIRSDTGSILFGFSGTERVRIDPSGRVGIGTTSPQELLHVNTGASGGQVLRMTTNGADTGYLYQNTAAVILGAYSTRFLGFETNGTERARIDSSGRLLVGTSTSRGNWYNTTGLDNSLQIEGTTHGGSGLSIVRSNNLGGHIELGGHGGTTIGSYTLVSSGANLGSISFQGADGTNFVESASIKAEVDGTPGANDMPGRLVFSTTADGASSPTERLRLDSSGRMLLGSTTARANFNNTTHSALFQVEAASASGAGAVGAYVAQIFGSSTAAVGPTYIFAKHASNSVGGMTAVVNNEELGRISFQGSDGTEFMPAATISCEVDGTPGANDMPGRLVFRTTSDAGGSPVPSSRFEIASNGQLSANIPEGFGSSNRYPGFLARAWVNFNGTGTVAIRGNGNVSSITDNTTGDYTVNFTTAMPDANYAVTASVITNSNASSSFIRGVDVFSTAAVTTGSVRVNSRAGGSGTFDADGVFVAIFR